MSLVFIASATASSSATLEFTSGIDSTYNEYQFQFVNMHPATDNANFTFQVNAAGESGFNEVMTTTAFYAYNRKTTGASALTYDGNNDQAQGTGYQDIFAYDVGNEGESSTSGILTLYDPSSITYVKHFAAVGSGIAYGTYVISMYNTGYINTTNAINQISFKFASGNIDAGTIYMYGVG